MNDSYIDDLIKTFPNGTLIILCGPPGSGKSTYASHLQHCYYCPVVCPDDIRQELTGDASDQTHNTEVFDTVYKRLIYYLQCGYSVVYDATNCRPNYRTKILSVVKDLAKKVVCIIFTTPIAECIKRNAERDRKVPDSVIEKMYLGLRNHPPTIYEGYDVIIRA